MNRLCLVVLLGLATTARAQQADPQNRFEPRSAPGAGQAYLAKCEGDWEVARTFDPQDGERLVMELRLTRRRSGPDADVMP